MSNLDFAEGKNSKNKEIPIILEFDDFANRCGYFYNAYLYNGVSANNGYNCRHTEQTETVEDEQSGLSVGCCHCWSCPMAYPAGAEDLFQYGVISEEEYQAAMNADGVYRGDNDYVIVSDADLIQKFRGHGVTGLAEEEI